MEKLCSHCGTTLLVGLQYCPGCLRVIDSRRSSDLAPLQPQRIDPAAEARISDFDIAWDHFFFPVKVAYHWIFRLPPPYEPPPIRTGFSGIGPKKKSSDPNSMRLSLSYTRVVCPKCLRAYRGRADLSPADLITCEGCAHCFPGSFAAEFRKGADLECFRCGVTTFCVTGLQVTHCPNCRYDANATQVVPSMKLKVLATVASLLFIAFFFNALATRTTSQFFLGVCIACVSSVVGFVTMVALGF